MKHFLLIFILIMLGVSARAQTYNDVISDSIVTEFLNAYLDKIAHEFNTGTNDSLSFIKQPVELMNPKKLSSQFTDWNSLFEVEGVNMDSIFSPQDKLYIIRQEQSRKEFLWVIKYNTFDFRDFEMNEEFFRISMPLFSKLMNLVIIKRYYDCGEDCGDEWISIYKRINNKWKEIYGWGFIM